MTRITCYDGVGCIGGNKILLEDDGARLFFDFGKNFGAEGQYYEEFIQPKPCAGLYELAQLHVLPAFRDLYRNDLVSGLCDPWHGLQTSEIGEIGGVLVSHAHVDHIGAIHHLRGDIPIHCSVMTAAMSKALQDTGLSSTAAEYCYFAPRTDSEAGLSSRGVNDVRGRRYYLTGDDASEEMCAFWNQLPLAESSKKTLTTCELSAATSCADRNILAFPVDHSVFGASAWAVETGAGWVVYSGDLRVHGSYADLTRQFVQKAAALKPIALIIEGTRIMSERGYTEGDVMASGLAAVSGCPGLVVADFGPRNVERLLSFLRIARQTGRELAILPKDAYLLKAMRAAGGEQEVPALDSPGIRIYWEFQSTESAWRRQLRELYPGLGVTPCDVQANQDKFICCFSFWDINELAYLQPVKDSLYVYSSCEAFSEEMSITAQRLDNWLKRFDMKRAGRLKEEEQESDPFHVSGHASGKDLMEIAQAIRAKVLIPVHTEHPEVYQEKLGGTCEVRMPERGISIEL